MSDRVQNMQMAPPRCFIRPEAIVTITFLTMHIVDIVEHALPELCQAPNKSDSFPIKSSQNLKYFTTRKLLVIHVATIQLKS